MKLSGSDKTLWRRLERANQALVAMYEAGIVDREVIVVVGERIERLEVLILADTASVELGGRRSDRLRDEIEKLTGVMIDLIDAAVEHEAAVLDSQDYVPLQLRDLRDVLEARTEGHREIRDLGKNSY